MYCNVSFLRRCQKAFTLVELLVVIGIIAVLVGILLPALNKARQSAQSIACAANLRSIAQAMIIYTAEFKGAIPGSAVTTGGHLFNITGTGSSTTFTLKPGINAGNSPDVIDIQDYVGPLARMMRLRLMDIEQGNTDVTESLNVVPRWRAYRNLKQFRCPTASGMIATEFTSTGAGTGPMLSYATAANFLFLSRGTATSNGGMSGSVWTPGSPYWILPEGYSPKITKIGQSSQKIYIADAARWSDGTKSPSFSIGGIGGGGWQNSTPFADFGAFTGASKAYGRWNTPEAGLTPKAFDVKLLSYRHGTRRPNLNGGSYRLNVAFFDGHVSTLDEMDSTNPLYWLPRGTRFSNTAVETFSGNQQWMIWPDTRARLGIPSGAWIVP